MNLGTLILWIIAHLPAGEVRDDLQAFYDKHYGDQGTVHPMDGGGTPGGPPPK